MADLELLDDENLSNKNLIIIANATEESIYFLEEMMNRQTTIILLNRIDDIHTHSIFHSLCIKLNIIVISLEENKNNNPWYKLTKKSYNVITRTIKENKFEKIITLQDNNIQNKTIFDLVYSFKLPNHYTYNHNNNNKITKRCNLLYDIMKLYKITDDSYKYIDGLKKYLFD